MIAKNSIKNNNSNTISIGSILYDNREDGYEINEEMNKEIKNYKSCININEEDVSSSNTIYRYKFTEDFMVDLYKFAKIHQYDDRKDFKEAWLTWVEDNKNIVDEEMHRLLYLGYEGDILDKMFKSARYYFRKKSTEKKQPKQRRQYISVNRELLNAMDNHIEDNMYNDNYQPKTGFITFCKDNEILLKDAISKLYEQGEKNSGLIEDKIKKTYKNRYFMLVSKK
jgi:hypothetical protein